MIGTSTSARIGTYVASYYSQGSRIRIKSRATTTTTTTGNPSVSSHFLLYRSFAFKSNSITITIARTEADRIREAQSVVRTSTTFATSARAITIAASNEDDNEDDNDVNQSVSDSNGGQQEQQTECNCNCDTITNWNEIDQQYIWHPYASIPNTNVPSYYVTSGNGPLLQFQFTTDNTNNNKNNNRTYTKDIVDGMSSWWACIHGYNNTILNNAIQEQLTNRLSHIMLGGITHPAIIELTNTLFNTNKTSPNDVVNNNKQVVLPQHFTNIFYSDSGSVSVEIAIKIAIQYWHNVLGSSSSSNSNNSKTTNTNKKTKFISLKGGYHGDTFMTMSISDPTTGMHQELFSSVLQDQYFVNRPTVSYGYNYSPSSTTDNDNNNQDEIFDAEIHMKEYVTLLENYHTTIAAIIVEPIVQGAGGMYFYSPYYLQQIQLLCMQYNILFIVDEIATGFGRTGQYLFAHEHANNTIIPGTKQEVLVQPDIMCIGKALSGGYMSFAATVTNKRIADAFAPNSTSSSSTDWFISNSLQKESTSTTTTTSIDNETTIDKLLFHNNKKIRKNTTGTRNNTNTVLMHGPTFMGNPLACAVSLASIQLLQQSNWQQKVQQIENQFRNELIDPIQQNPHIYTNTIIKNVRVFGAIGVIEMKHSMNIKNVQNELLYKHNVWLRPFGKLLYAMPPYNSNISTQQLSQITTAMLSIASNGGKNI